MMRRVISLAATPLRRLPTGHQLRHQSVRQPLHDFDSFLAGTSAAYLEDLYLQWKEHPTSVDASFHEVFEKMDRVSQATPLLSQPIRVASTLADTEDDAFSGNLSTCRHVTSLIKEYARNGHLVAKIDPLAYDAEATRSPEKEAKGETLTSISASERRLDPHVVVETAISDRVGGLHRSSVEPRSAKELIDALKLAYTGRIAFEFAHIHDEHVLFWLRERIDPGSSVVDNPLTMELSPALRRTLLSQVSDAVQLEKFLQKKYQGQKRFGLDGGESLIVGLHAAADRLVELGAEELNIGMAHRGRLNVLCNFLGKPIAELIKEFNKIQESDVGDFPGQGDVKYHNGWCGTIRTTSGAPTFASMLHNPSHLECINPFVQGITKAAQVSRGDVTGKTAVPIELHGDAAFVGQGVIFESINLSGVPASSTGGTIHVVINNQVGFTTDPSHSRGSRQPTDVARTFQCPVLHVNGDSVEDVYRAFRLAAEFRQTFNRSVFINLVCYRRNGHNESDDPSMTQPLLYKIIAKTPDVMTLYGQQLTAHGVPAEAVASITEASKQRIEQEAATYTSVKYLDAINRARAAWRPYQVNVAMAVMNPTAVSAELLAPVIKALSTLPPDFNLHPNLKGIHERRAETLRTGRGLEWGTAEALAMGSLLLEGIPVRLSGQDVERATFSQRHAVVHDMTSDATHTALQHILPEKQATFTVANSTLSEFGVLGFETGYGSHDPKSLVVWEAQYADFANGAQVIMDQFLVAGESKWNQQYNIVLSLPHGYDGAGPEHSSGRIERYLQAVSEDDAVGVMPVAERHFRCNIEVTFPTTPKQYFHLLRRHIARNFRKPLFVFFSKSNLRAPNVSSIDEFTAGEFEPVIDDASVTVDSAEVQRVIFCTGQVYFHLANAKKQRNAANVAVVRIEQLSPFPRAEVNAVLAKYSSATKVVWAQDEPRNMGAWSYIEPRLEVSLAAVPTKGSVSRSQLIYAGRLASPSPATGYGAVHTHEQNALIEEAFNYSTSDDE